LIGKGVEPLALLVDLREHEVGENVLGMPGGCGSRISVRIVPLTVIPDPQA